MARKKNTLDLLEKTLTTTTLVGLSSLSDHSILVQCFLWENDLDAAWNEARSGGCSGSLWLELVKL